MSIIKSIISIALILVVGGATYSLMLADPADVAAAAKYNTVLAKSSLAVYKAEAEAADIIRKAEASVRAAKASFTVVQARRDALLEQYADEYRASKGPDAPTTVADTIKEEAKEKAEAAEDKVLELSNYLGRKYTGPKFW